MAVTGEFTMATQDKSKVSRRRLLGASTATMMLPLMPALGLMPARG
jgi:hypothetical protein